jgi:CHAT domain-containing protein/tetratricopeptide (TPR) repeat protein
MNEAQFPTYRHLVNKLLECPSGEELEILKSHRNLLDENLVKEMQQVGEELESQGKQNDAYWLQSFAGMLLGFIRSHPNKSSEEYLSSLNQVLQAYDDKVLETEPQVQTLNNKLSKLSAKALRHWGKFALKFAIPQVARRIELAIENHCDRALKSSGSDKTGYQIEVAIAGYETILPFFTYADEPKKWAKIQSDRGYAYSRRILGNRAINLERAIEYLQEVLAKYEKIYNLEENPERWAKICDRLGYAFRNRIYGDIADNLENAIKFYQAALKVDISEYLPEETAEIYISLGISYRKRIHGDKEKNLRTAIQYYQQALEICDRNKYPEKWAKIQNALGIAHYNLGIVYFYSSRKDNVDNFCLAIKFYSQSLEVRNYETNPQEWARVKRFLGDAYRDRECNKEEKEDNLKQALECYKNALDVYTEKSNPEEWAQVQKSLGNAYRKLARSGKLEHFDDAIASHKEALKILTKRRFPNEFADISFYLGLDYYEIYEAHKIEKIQEGYEADKEEKIQRSFDFFKQAIETVEVLRDEIISGDDIKQKFAENWNTLYRCMVEVCIKQGKYIEAIQYVEGSKNRSLIELIINRDVESIFTPDKVQEIKKDNEDITKLKYKIQTNQYKKTDEYKLIKLRKKRDRLQNQIIGIGEEFQFKNFQSHSLQNSDCVFVEFYLTRKYFLIFIFTSNSPKPIVLNFSKSELDKLEKWAKSYFERYDTDKFDWQNHLENQLHQLAQILHLDEIIDEISANIPKNFQTLILVPHQYLHLLPIHALPINTSFTEKNTQTLMECFPGGVFYIPSCQLYRLVKQRRNCRFQNLFAIQTPTDDLYEQDLGAIGAIKKEFNDVYILKNEKAKKSELIHLNEENKTPKINDKLKEADCIIFFCHGKFEPDEPLKSRLQLADDDLTLEDIISVDFQLKYGSLVTLGACETSLTNRLDIGDEYISLSYGFLLARSSNVISSLWTVSTSATALLIIKFYEELKIENQIAVALNKAQLWLYKSTVVDFRDWLQKSQLSDAWKIALNKEFHDIENEKGANIKPFESPYYWAAFRLIGKGESPMSVYESAILSFIDVIRVQCSIPANQCQSELSELIVDLPEDDEDIVEKIEDWLKTESRSEFLKLYRENLKANGITIDLDKQIVMPPGGKGYESNKKPKSQAKELLINAIHESNGNSNSSDKKG